jgi:hypothetical protein
MGEGGNPLKMSAGEFSLEVKGNPEEDAAVGVTEGHLRIKVLKRASPASYAVLGLQSSSSTPGFEAASNDVAAKESWEKVAVFRLRRGEPGKERAVDVLQMAAQRDGKSIRLSQPVDSSVFGSPIATPEGVIGFVQDEQSGAFLPVAALSPAPQTAPVR